MLDSITIELVLLILIGVIMLISILVGLIQGFRKNTYYFCATIVFWIIFWITAPIVTGNLIFANEWLFSTITSILPIDVGDSTTLIDFLVKTLAQSMEIDPTLASDPAISNTLIAIIQSVAKLIYLPILAFNFFFFKIIIYHAVFKRYFKANKRILRRLNKKNDKYIQKHNEPNKDLEKRIRRVERQIKTRHANRFGGLLSGAARGLLTSFLILCVVNSTVKLLPTLPKDDNISASTEENSNKTPNIYDFILSQTGNSEVVKTALDMIADYQSSYLINTTGIKIGSKSADELFIDSILSGKSMDYSFELRNELSTIIQIAEKAFNLTNGFNVESVEWTKLSDQQVEELNGIIILLSDTNLLNNLASVLVGAALSMDAVAPYMPEDLSPEEYKNIDWSAELKTIAQLVSEVYSLGPDIAKLNYFDLDPEIVKNIVLTLSSLQSINFLGHVGSSFAVKSLVQDDPLYAQTIQAIEQDLADMALNGAYGKDIASFSDLYASFIDVYKNTDFSKYQDEEGNITNIVAVLTSVETTKYQNLVSTILQTNFLTELLPNVLTIVKEKLLAQSAPEIASMINPNVVTTTQWEREINSLLQLISDITKDENGMIHPFESIEKYDFTLLSGFTTKTIVESELLSYAMIKILIDTSNGTGILKENAESISSIISIPDYLKQDADSNYRFNSKWYGDPSTNYSNGELFIVIDTVKNCISQLESLDYPVGSFPAILSQIHPETLFESDVLYYTVNKLIDSNRQFIVVPLSEVETSEHTVNGMFIDTMVSRNELSSILNIFTDRNIVDLESLFVYFKLVENEDGTVSQVQIDKEEKDENTVVLLDTSINKILGLLTSDKLYNPNDIADNGKNIDKLFASKILRATLTNLVDTMLNGMIAVPLNSVETTNNDCLVYEKLDEQEEGNVVEKQVNIIRQDQFKSLLMAVKDLDVDLTMFVQENIDPVDIINSFKNEEGSLKEEAKPIFGSMGYNSSKYSGILHGTISKYIIEFSTIKDENGMLVVPTESIDAHDENLINADEMINLLNSVVILGGDILSSEMNDEQVDVIISKVIENNEVLDSNIIKATLTKIVSDTETIKIPNAAFDANITSEKVIAKSHIVDLLNSVNSLKIASNSSNFMDMLDINNLTIKSIKNANNNNEISNSLIIRSVLTQVIIDELELEIPSSACDENNTLTLSETNALINTICGILPADSSFTNISIEGIDMSTLVNAKEDIKQSLVVKSLLTKTLKEQTSGVVVVPSTALENEIISNKEIDNLIAGLDIIMKDSDSFTNIDINSIQLKDLQQAKDCIYESKILNATIAQQIKNLSNDGTLIVPEQAFEVDYPNELNKNEVDNLIIGMTTMLGEESSISNINVDNIKIYNLRSASSNIANSKILNATVTNQLKQQTDIIVIPEVSYNDDPSVEPEQLLDESEVNNILLGLEKLLGRNTTITTINPDNITTTSLENAKAEISNSLVLNATITNKLNGIDAIVIPEGCNHSLTSKAIDEEQMNNLITGLVKLLGKDKSITTIDVNSIVLGDLSESTTEINNSLILRATLTNQIASQEMLKVPSTAYESEEMFTAFEMKNIIDGIVKLLGSETTITTINPDNITTTSLENAKAEISNSEVLNATITDKIITIETVTVPSESLKVKVEVSDPNQIENIQMNNLITGLVKLLGKDKSITTIDVNSIVLGDLSESTTEINNSLILRATLTNQIASQEMLKVPSTAYESEEMFSVGEMKNIIDGIVKLLGSETTITTINPDNITTTSLENAKAEISNSLVLNATITDKIIAIETVTVPSESLKVKVEVSDPNQIENTQMNNLITGLVKLLGKDKSITTIDVNSIVLGDLSESTTEINNSLILRATLTNQIASQEMLKVPSTAYESEEMFSVDEMKNIIDGIVKLLGSETTITTINPDNITTTSLENAKLEIANSEVLNATITDKIIAIETVTVPSESLKVKVEVSDPNQIENTQMNNLITGLVKLLGEDKSITTIDVNSIKLGHLSESTTEINNSLILRATLTNQIASQEMLKVPSTAYESEEMFSVDEMKNIIDGIVKLLGSETTITTINPDNITTTSLENAKLEIANSEVLNATITDKIIAIETITVPSESLKVKVEVSDPNQIENTQMNNLITGLVKLLGKDKSITTIDVESIKVNNLDSSKVEIANSLILNATITNKLKDKDSIVIPSQTAHVDCNLALDEEEMIALIGGLVQILDSDDSISSININNLTIGKLNNAYKQGYISSSAILVATITKQINNLKDSNTLLVPDNSYVDETKISLTTEELGSLLDGLTVLLDENSAISSINVSTLTISKLSDSSAALKASLILNATITDKIASQVSVPNEAYKDINLTMLKDSEIDAFMNSLVSIFGPEATINALPIDTLTIKSINDNIDTITSSYILRQTITEKIELQNAIIIPENSYETTMLETSEIKSMFKVLGLLVDENSSINNLSGFTNCSIAMFATNINEISNSLILRATVSKEVLGLTMLKVPQIAIDSAILDYNVIETNEFINLFVALNNIYSGDISNDTIDLSNTKIDNSKSAEIATSIIMRTTITQNIKVTVNGTDKPIYVVESNIEQLVSYDNLAIYYNVMTSDELVDVIASVNVLLGGNSGFEVSLDLATLISASSNIDTLLGSDVMIIAVSEYLLDNYGMYCHSFEKETLPSLVELPSGNKVANKEVLTKTSIISIINLLKSFAG